MQPNSFLLCRFIRTLKELFQNLLRIFYYGSVNGPSQRGSSLCASTALRMMCSLLNILGLPIYGYVDMHTSHIAVCQVPHVCFVK